MTESKRPKGDTSFSSSTENSSEKSGERVQKLIAQAGLASRRDAEDLIRDGLVTINGKTAALGDKATLGVDAIKVKGKLIHFAATKVYYMIYKPKNFIAMIAEDEEGRPTLKDLINKQIKERLFPVGRMDFKGEGAIILTNDGDMAQKILKSNDIIRRYHVKVDRHPTQEDLARLARGGRIDGRSMQPYHVRVAEGYNRNSLIEISFEGMGAVDVKQFFENKGFFPEKVARVGIGHISAENLKPGDFKKLNPSSVEALFLQPELAKKHIERLVDKRAGGVKVVDVDALEADANDKRRGRSGSFTTDKEARNFSPVGFKRADAPKGKVVSKDAGANKKRNEQRHEKFSRNPKGRAVRAMLNDGSERAERALARPSRPATRTRDDDRPRVSPHPFGDRPRAPRAGADRPARPGADRPGRSFGDKRARPGADRAERPSRSFGDARRGSARPAAGAGKIRFKRTIA
jgi:23S rRNA pseudouridine2605 synthase